MPKRWDTAPSSIPATYCSLHTRALHDAVGGWPVEAIGWEDWWYWVHCWMLDPKVTYLDRELLRYRIHAASMTAKDVANKPQLYAMLRLAHPALYAEEQLAEDRAALRLISPDLLARLRKRSEHFPYNHTLRAFLALSGA